MKALMGGHIMGWVSLVMKKVMVKWINLWVETWVNQRLNYPALLLIPFISMSNTAYSHRKSNAFLASLHSSSFISFLYSLKVCILFDHFLSPLSPLDFHTFIYTCMLVCVYIHTQSLISKGTRRERERLTMGQALWINWYQY